MALIIENRKIVGTIDNLEDKLEGKIPVDRLELLYLVNSWVKNKYFEDHFELDEHIENGYIPIEFSEKKCYDLSKLDTSKITDMSQLFYYSEFNGDISNWDVSNVTNMHMMFYNAKSFNQVLNNWDVSNVTNMGGMFRNAEKFNQALNNWNVSNVIDMKSMFFNTNFNQTLNNWNVSKVTNMRAMFCLAKELNQNLNNWDVSNVTQMSEMFQQASNFNQPLNNWNVSNVTNMGYMFYNAKSFKEKYNSGEPLPTNTDDIKDWFNLNREKMNVISIKDQHGDEIDEFFSSFSNNHKNKEIK